MYIAPVSGYYEINGQVVYLNVGDIIKLKETKTK